VTTGVSRAISDQARTIRMSVRPWDAFRHGPSLAISR
jgi:hypothetical protein